MGVGHLVIGADNDFPLQDGCGGDDILHRTLLQYQMHNHGRDGVSHPPSPPSCTSDLIVHEKQATRNWQVLKGPHLKRGQHLRRPC